MHASNSALHQRPKTFAKQLGIVVAWLLFTFVAFAQLSQTQLVDFDANNQLEHLTTSELTREIALLVNQASIERSVIHFSQDNCACQQVSQRHIAAINKLAKQTGFSTRQVKLSEQSVVPSTPSVAIYEGEELVYFGPYGQGIACSQTNGFAQTVLNNLIKGYRADIIVSEAKGCYCAV